MLTALAKNFPSRKLYAQHSSKSDGPFICPLCKEEVVIHKGMVRVHHFKHKNITNCNFGSGETEIHRLIKESVARDIAASLKFETVDIEHDLGYAIPDVYISQLNTKIAIEIQKSAITPNEALLRTVRYYKNKTAVLWICTPFDLTKLEKYSPRELEKWFHATYFGGVTIGEKGKACNLFTSTNTCCTGKKVHGSKMGVNNMEAVMSTLQKNSRRQY